MEAETGSIGEKRKVLEKADSTGDKQAVAEKGMEYRIIYENTE